MEYIECQERRCFCNGAFGCGCSETAILRRSAKRSNVKREFYFLVAFCFFFDAAASFLSRLINKRSV